MSSRLTLVRVMIKRESWVFSAYGPCSEKCEEVRRSWNLLNECCCIFGSDESAVVLEDLNARASHYYYYYYY